MCVSCVFQRIALSGQMSDWEAEILGLGGQEVLKVGPGDQKSMTKNTRKPESELAISQAALARGRREVDVRLAQHLHRPRPPGRHPIRAVRT